VSLTRSAAQVTLPVTVVIPVKNEEANLGRCLSRLTIFADVVVVDSGSTDRTLEIAAAHGVRVVQFTWDGRFPKKRNWFLLNHPPTQPWILFLDADEFVDGPFCDALARATEDEGVQGLWLTYTNWFLGRPLRYGVPQRKLACFRTGAGLYERIDEDRWSRLDMEVHEHPVIAGRIGEIAVPIDHHDDKGIARFIDRHRDYAEWEARRVLKLRQDSSGWDDLTSRQRFKYRNLGRWWYPFFYFLFTYLVKRGFFDGRAGFHYAAYKMWYFRTIGLLIEETTTKTTATPTGDS
jgi:glycosyltransferase involved in cell wall biosynthesis